MVSTPEYFNSAASLDIHKAPQIEDELENKVQSLKSKKKAKDRKRISYLCNVCNKSFDKKSRLSRHILSQHENIKPSTPVVDVSCDVEGCNKTFRYKSRLERHTKSAHNLVITKKNYKCIYCDMSFKRQDRLDRHLFTHTKEKTFRCDVEGCDKTYANKSHLNRHKKSFHEAKPEIASFKCFHSGCNQMFTNKSNMVRHYNTHHVHLLPYSCSECEEKFRRKLQLKKHEIKKHSRQYPYTCSQCNKGFLSSYTLLSHVCTHKGGSTERPCTDCGETFSKWSLLVEHRRRFHRNEKQFVCDLCDKTFSRKPNIKQHLQVHMTTVTMFQCHYDNCSKFYSSKRNLMSHIRSKHEGKRWQCDFCDRQLTTKQKLVQHVHAHMDPERSKLLRKTFHSVASKLLGVELHNSLEKKIIDGAGAEVTIDNFPPPLESTHETSETEHSDF